MKVSRAAVMAVAFFSMLLLLGCGDTYRPIATPIYQSGGDPQSFHFGVVVSQGSSNGATSVIDTTGDTNIGNVKTGNSPVHTVLFGSSIITANRDSDTLTIQSVTTPTVSSTVILADNPTDANTKPPTVNPVFVHPYVSSSATRLYVAGFTSGEVLVVDASMSPPAVSARIPLGGASHPVALTSSSDGSKVYVLNRDAGNVQVISPVDNTVSPSSINVGGNPVYALTNPNGKAVYVLSAGPSSSLKVIDPVTDAILPLPTEDLTGSGNPDCMASTMGSPCASMVLDSTLQRLYVASYGENKVRVYDTNEAVPGWVATISVGAGPVAVAVQPNGSRAYVLDKGETTGCSGEANSGRVSVINTSTNKVNGCITVAANPVWLAITSDGSRLLVPHQGGTPGTQVISTSTNKVVADQPAPLAHPDSGDNTPMNPVFVFAQ